MDAKVQTHTATAKKYIGRNTTAANAANSEDSARPNMPKKKFRAGPISATVWENSAISKTGEAVTYSTISVERNYKDKDDNWKSTNSLRVNDLPKAMMVMGKAYEFLVLKDSEESYN